MRDQDEFDILRFLMTVLGLLTIVVGVYAALTGSQVSQANAEIKREVLVLDQMDKLAKDPAFRDWIAREREGRNQGTGSAADFKALLNDHARKQGLNVRDTGEAGTIDHPGGTKELRFRMRIEGCKLEALTKFLVSVEEDWAGAKTREIPEMTIDEKSQTWTASIVVAIFKHADQQP
ncbi:hypothetical protein HY251_07635 [bacterium]|nr:hypothetical protein [bacterium]